MATQYHHSYPVFEKNQVLTHSQLNDTVKYLEEQDRLTRSGLIGIGIVCGFELKYVTKADSDAGKDTLGISAGVGITSEGYLISSPRCELTRYREYPAGEFGDYPPFINDQTGEYDVKPAELLSDNFQPNDDSVLKPLSKNFLNNKVVLLFLEVYDKNLKSCLSKGCDEVGIERKINLRRLLVSTSDMKKILERTENKDITLYPKRFGLKDFTLKRAEFDLPAKQFKTLPEIGKPYEEVLLPDGPGNDPVLTLFGYWKDAYEAFRPVLSTRYPDNPFADAGITERLNTWHEVFAGSNSHFGIQYYYDFVKDLALAYREFREVSFDLLTRCRPDDRLFPRHLSLGEVSENCVPSEYRQQFIQSPVYNNQNVLLEKSLSLFTRAVLMVEAFDVAIVRSVEKYDLKVTPSAGNGFNLTQRAIPFYYSSGIIENKDHGFLEQYWNHDLARRCLLDSGVLSYSNNFSHDDDADVEDNAVFRPLHHDRDRYGFYRIEGVLGKPCAEVLDNLDNMIRRHNLPFDVLALRLNNSTEVLDHPGSNAIDYSRGFHDLHEDYYTFRYHLVNMIKTGVSIFELDTRLDDTGSRAERTDDYSRAAEGDELIVHMRYYAYKTRKTLEIEEPGELNEISKILLEFMCGSLPPCLPDFIDKFEGLKASYSSAIEYVVRKIFIRFEKLSQKIPAGVLTEAHLERVQESASVLLRLLYHLMDSVFFNRLFRIYYAFRRREYYYSFRQNPRRHTFTEYLEAHPGMEHAAGAPAHGTFLVVYGDHNSAKQRVLADFMLPYRVCDRQEASIPVCDDDQARRDIKVAPYARPVFAVTLMNKSVSVKLLENVHDLYHLENEHCVPDEKVIRNVKLTGIKPENQDSRVEETDEGIVKITPPDNFTGILDFTYDIVSLSNNLTSSGRLKVLVLGGCHRYKDINLQMRPEQTEVVKQPDSLFNDPEYDREIIFVNNLQEALEITLQKQISAPYSFTYTTRIQNKSGGYLTGCGTIIIHPVSAHTVTGRVTDEKGGALPGVNITVQGTTTGTITDVKGNYMITVPSPDATLVFSFIGYLQKIVPVEGRTRLDVVMTLEREVTFDRGRVREHLIDLTNDDLKMILEDRSISYTTSETKNDLIRKLEPELLDKPITRNELEKLSDRSLNRLKADIAPEPDMDTGKFLDLFGR